MKTAAWRFRWNYPKTGEATIWTLTDSEEVARQRGQEGYEVEPLVRLSDAEARIAELIEWEDMWKGIAEANEARAEAAEALLKEAGNCMGIVLKNAKRVDMHGNGALSDIVGPWYMDQMRAIHHKIGVKDE